MFFDLSIEFLLPKAGSRVEWINVSLTKDPDGLSDKTGEKATDTIEKLMSSKPKE